ncbi:MAG: FCD domain-containing protein [Chloroflexi bacterium]|nr:FCD domain-containing protein [Chloroflexota bacterium]
MRRHLDAETVALERGDVEALDSASTAFHTAIAEASDSSLLADVAARYPRTLAGRCTARARLHAIRDEHEQLCRAIANGDAEAAAQISLRHAVANRLATLAAIHQHAS